MGELNDVGEESGEMFSKNAQNFLYVMEEAALLSNASDIQLLITFYSCVEQGELLANKYADAAAEKTRLEKELIQAEKKRNTLTNQLTQARSLIDGEKMAASEALRSRNQLKKQQDDVLRLLPESRRHELLSKLPPINKDPLHSSSEINFTTDTTSSAVYSSETDSDDWHLFPPSRISRRRSAYTKESRDSEHFVVMRRTNNLTENNNSQSDIINSAVANLGRESLDYSSFQTSSNGSAVFYASFLEDFKNRPHKFCSKRLVLGDRCISCSLKTSCGEKGLQCEDCRCVTHKACQNLAPKPCIFMKRIRKKSPLSIRDYCPQFRPYIPALVVHCILQIEERGLNVAGLYKVPSFDRSVQNLKNRFAEYGIVNLSQVEVKVISVLLKDFFATLKPALIAAEEFSYFREYLESHSHHQITFSHIFDIVHRLESPVKDTLAFLILHLQEVSKSARCKMSARSLSKIFTPLLVDNYTTECYKKEVKKWSLLEKFIGLPSEVWKCALLKDF